MLVILGPTATGKTVLAARIASEMDGEVISADSRQVYRGMDIGTGKDYQDYIISGHKIPVHLIDIADPGYEYNIFEYQQDFLKAYQDIIARGKYPILCGGSGMYLESVLKGYRLKKLEKTPALDSFLGQMQDEELRKMLLSFKTPHNTTDLLDRNRLIKAVRIAHQALKDDSAGFDLPDLKPVVVGIRFDRAIQRQRISERLKRRLQGGMIEEVERLLKKGLSADQLSFYGLEYKYVTQYLNRQLDYEKMHKLLETAIHQFSKRQMTWFRRMERSGTRINWLDGMLGMDEKVIMVKSIISKADRNC